MTYAKTMTASALLALVALAGCSAPQETDAKTEASSIQTVEPSKGPTKAPETPKPKKTQAPVVEDVAPAPAPVVEQVAVTPVEPVVPQPVATQAPAPAPKPVVIESPAPVAVVAPVQAPKPVVPATTPTPAPKPVQATPAPSSGGHNWSALAQCESGGNPGAVSPGGMYHGLYQFSVPTWQSVGGTGLPSQASAAEQTKRAQMLAAQATPASQWPVCSANM